MDGDTNRNALTDMHTHIHREVCVWHIWRHICLLRCRLTCNADTCTSTPSGIVTPGMVTSFRAESCGPLFCYIYWLLGTARVQIAGGTALRGWEERRGRSRNKDKDSDINRRTLKRQVGRKIDRHESQSRAMCTAVGTMPASWNSACGPKCLQSTRFMHQTYCFQSGSSYSSNKSVTSRKVLQWGYLEFYCTK